MRPTISKDHPPPSDAQLAVAIRIPTVEPQRPMGRYAPLEHDACEAARMEVAAATGGLAEANVYLPSAEARLRWLSGTCTALTFALGCMVLVGWGAHIPWLKSVLARFVAMRPLTAASFVQGSVGLALLLIGGRARTVGRAVGALMVLDGLGALLEYV